MHQNFHAPELMEGIWAEGGRARIKTRRRVARLPWLSKCSRGRGSRGGKQEEGGGEAEEKRGKGEGEGDGKEGQSREDVLGGQKGLWTPPLRREVSERMEGPKRRWTVNDR